MLKALKQNKQKTLLSNESAKGHIEFLKTSGFSYTLKISNYTTEIISDLYNIQFVQSMRGKQCFAAYSKIKSDISKKELPIVDKEKLRYFEHDFKADFFAEEIYNVDLKSAYATILYNDNYISESTFKYLSKIPKLDRLASVGMLASKKHIFEYNDKGELKNYSKYVSPTENFFFYCVQKTDEIMQNLKFICYEKYLFSWVDGIYFNASPDLLSDIQHFLLSNFMPFTVDILKDFRVQITGNKCKISFKKNGKIKFFQIPAKNNEFANDILNYLNYKK